MKNAADLFRLDSKIAVVTGGAGLYGCQIVQALAEVGAHVIIVARHLEKCHELADDLRRKGLHVSAERCDLSQESEIHSLRDRIISEHGHLDILFNNAVARAGGDLQQMSASEWDESMRVNSTGLFLTCRILSEPMQTQRCGSIVNISSIYGMVGPDFSIYEGTGLTSPVSYAFAKGGMINLTRYLASFLAPYNIRANSLSPGGLQTDDMPDSFVLRYRRKTLLGRMADADDIKGPAVFLASDASRYITGQNIAVDGGWTAI